ncbi:MAG TPA: class I SAM-dependent methyltransferase [Polyangiaceae bacterium]|nr:class I SAM-dependent methyltransferase [Polyangiaceae bacterium]
MDLDRYYTPEDVAERLAAAVVTDSGRCVDASCGDGRLLSAAVSVAPGTSCVGIDKDPFAIRRLRRQRPEWILSVGDALRSESLRHCHAAVSGKECDFLLANPPFSRIKGHKGLTVDYEGTPVTCSVAMAYMLRALDVFQPQQGTAAVVPESLVYSDLDSEARRLLGEHYTLDVLGGLKNSTFAGARANAVLVRLTGGTVRRRKSKPTAWWNGERPRIHRGGLPVFELTKSRNGVRFVHTTDLQLGERHVPDRLMRVKPLERGLVGGSVILLPRVGVPSLQHCVPFYFRSKVQLSDCVIALKFTDAVSARSFSAGLLRRFVSLRKLYRGTGARYVTVARLEEWLDGACGSSLR